MVVVRIALNPNPQAKLEALTNAINVGKQAIGAQVCVSNATYDHFLNICQVVHRMVVAVVFPEKTHTVLILDLRRGVGVAQRGVAQREGASEVEVQKSQNSGRLTTFRRLSGRFYTAPNIAFRTLLVCRCIKYMHPNLPYQGFIHVHVNYTPAMIH